MQVGELRTVHYRPRPAGGFEASSNVIIASGRRRKLRGYGDTKEEASADLRRKAAEASKTSKPVQLSGETPIEELAKRWIAHIRRDAKLSVGTKDRYEGVMRTKILPEFGGLPISALTVPVLEDYLQMLAEEYSSNYVKLIRTVLIQALQYAVRLTTDIPVNNAKETTPIFVRPRDAHPLTADQVLWVRRELDWWLHRESGHRARVDIVQDVIEVILGTSLRPSEVTALQVRHIDVDRQRIHVNSTMVASSDGLIHQDHAKSAKQHRYINVPDFAWAVIKTRYKRVSEYGDSAYLFHSQSGVTRPYLQCGLLRTLREFRTQHPLLRPQLDGFDLSALTFVTFRKTAATAVAEAQGIESAQRLLGHSSSKITSTYYVPHHDSVIDTSITGVLQSTFGPRG